MRIFATNFSISQALCVSALLSTPFFSTASSTGVSGYVPLNQNPYLESHINRLMVAAEMGAVKRPYAINHVRQAAHKLCDLKNVTKPALKKGCYVVKDYLSRVDSGSYVNHASVSARYTRDSDLNDTQPTMAIANHRGEVIDASWQMQGQAILTYGDYLALSAGAKAWQGEVNLEDSYVSIGVPYLQLDVGYKPHWLSPFKQSAMLLSTHAPTFANVSVSNNTPLTEWNINYELFAGQLSESQNILYQGELITGKPMLTGVHFSMSPAPGFTLALNRILQSGGGERGNGFGDILDAFFDPSGSDNTSADLSVDEQFGNQAASIVARFDFPGDTPFSIYMEYAGEDTSRGTNYRLGNSSLSAGFDFPLLFNRFSMNYEYSNWQNGWYAHHVYRDGLVNESRIIGHYAAELRARSTTYAGEAIGATNHNFELGWQLSPSERLEFGFNATKNTDFSDIEYVTARTYSVDWYTQLVGYRSKLSLINTRNTLDEKFTSISVTLFH